MGGGARSPAPRGWLKVVCGGSQSALPGSPRDRPLGPGGPPLAVRPRVFGPVRRADSLPGLVLFFSFRSFSPSGPWSSTHLAGLAPEPRSAHLCRRRRAFPPRLASPRLAAMGGGRLVSPPRPPVRPVRLADAVTGAATRGRVSLPRARRRPAPCPPPPAVAASLRVGARGFRLSPRGPVRSGVPERRPGPGQPSRSPSTRRPREGPPGCRPGRPSSVRARVPALDAPARVPRRAPHAPAIGSAPGGGRPARAPLRGAAACAAPSSAGCRGGPSASPPLGKPGPPPGPGLVPCRAPPPPLVPAAPHALLHARSLARSLAFLPRSARPARARRRAAVARSPGSPRSPTWLILPVAYACLKD